ncbi:hypothetical protein MNBD_GAMMA07-764 [hydrothermal vent metagenome]|uniref:Uncharacterized protein n=1 Tax=hydrothermal vent metagenome TaxID=652676 RepID=A0A3B0XDM3_9ZZZZ
MKKNTQELEKIFEFLNVLKESLFELYVNGYKPDIISHKLNISHYENDYNILINTIKNV